MRSSAVFNLRILAGVLVFASVVHAESSVGTPGDDYPNYHTIPETSFSCSGQKYIPGFYADLETNCQVFHFCFKDGVESFLCPTGTIYNQAILACDSWNNSNCSLSPLFYNVNSGPALTNAGKKLPMLMKLSNRTQGKGMPTSNIFETLSSLYGSDGATLNEGVQATSHSGNVNEESSSNVSSDQPSETSPEGQEMEKEQLSVRSLTEPEVDADGVSVEVEETDSVDESENNLMEEQDDEPEERLVYDPIRHGYYMGYDPYGEQWQEGSEPSSDEFRKYYDYEEDSERDYGYENPPERGYGDPENSYDWTEDYYMEPVPEVDQSLDGEKFEFLKRVSNNRYRRRPSYVVVDDSNEGEFRTYSDEEIEAELATAVLLNVEPTTEAPRTTTEEAEETTERPELTDEDVRNMQFSRASYPTDAPMTSEEFNSAMVREFVLPQFENVPDEDLVRLARSPVAQPGNEEMAEDEQIYVREESDEGSFQGDEQLSSESDYPPEGYEFRSAYDSDAASYEDGVNDVPESEASVEEDTFIVIPDEADEVPDSGAVDGDETSDVVDSVEYATDEDSAEQVEVDNLSDAGYGPYDDAYEYYASHRELPDGYETGRSSSYEGPRYAYSENYEGGQYSPEEAYGGYGQYVPQQEYGQYVPQQEYGQYVPQQEYEQYQDMDYSTPEGARLAYMSGYLTKEEYRHILEQHGYVDPAQGADENGYLREDVYENAYVEGEDNSNYAAGEAREYYEQPDAAWVGEDFEEVEAEDRMGVTEVPLPVDVTEAAFMENEIASDGVPLEEDGQDLTSDSGDEKSESEEETIYVFDFEEDGEGKSDMGNESSFDVDASETPDVDNYSDKFAEENLQSIDDPFMNVDNTSSSEGSGMPLEDGESGNPDLNASDPFLTSGNTLESSSGPSSDAFDAKLQTDNAWPSSFATESGRDKPAALPPAFERLAVLNSAKSPQASSSFGNLDMSSMAFPESMDFGPYGYGAGMGYPYGMVGSKPSEAAMNEFSHRGGEAEQSKTKLSSLQARLRSMKRGKFGAFKKYMNSMKIEKR